jgi:hypothetical protein
MAIEPLYKSTTEKGGRPTKWNENVPYLYEEYLRKGYTHKEIIDGWRIQHTVFMNWCAKSPRLGLAYENRSEADVAGKVLAAYEHSDDETKERMCQELAEIALNRSNKPTERITAMREWFDRKFGKAVQSTIIEQNTTYTIIANIPAPPNSQRVALPDIDGEAVTIE